LLLELNLMRKAWKPFAKLDIEARGLKNVIKWGTSTNFSKDD